MASWRAGECWRRTLCVGAAVWNADCARACACGDEVWAALEHGYKLCASWKFRSEERGVGKGCGSWWAGECWRGTLWVGGAVWDGEWALACACGDEVWAALEHGYKLCASWKFGMRSGGVRL